MREIRWEQFAAVELRVGTVVSAEPFPEAIKPAYKIAVDFGESLGIRRSSAQLTELYDPEDLVGRQVVGVVNLPPKQIGPFVSEFLITGFPTEGGAIALAVPDQAVPNGVKLI